MITEDLYKFDNDIKYVTIDMIEEAHNQNDVGHFLDWYQGQTGSIASNGDSMIYAWDYEAWLEFIETGKEAGMWD